MNRMMSVEVPSNAWVDGTILSWKERGLQSRFSSHRDFTADLEDSKSIDRETLVNILNHLHFTNGSVRAILWNASGRDKVFVNAKPQPCLGKELVCRLSDGTGPDFEGTNYQFLHLLIDDGRRMIVTSPSLKAQDSESFTVELPEIGHVVGERWTKRYAPRAVTVEVDQGAFEAKGELLDFSPMGFCIKVTPKDHSFRHWFSSEELVTVRIRDKKQILFSGGCRCIREGSGSKEREIVVVPAREDLRVFPRRKIRNPRQRLLPPPYVVFDHPFCNKRVKLDVSDISTSGFSVHEKAREGYLIQGMVIPKLKINFSGGLEIECIAQVVYRAEENEKTDRYGLSILDMDPNSYGRLAHIITNALDPHVFVSCDVDMDALWEFFFKTGFIYPKKYGLICSQLEGFAETYRKLYQESPEIAKHFTYQKNGEIYGHISMIRAYEKAWLIHHHAATTMENRRAGFSVLKGIMYYLNDMHRLPSAKLDYVMSYFRPDNRFPNRVFGEFSRVQENPRSCSMDLFSYLPYTSLSVGAGLPDGWLLGRCSARDIRELNRFYGDRSGGLFLDVLSLGPKKHVSESLEDTCAKLGFFRKSRVYSLTNQGKLNAVLIADQSDLGLNLSELLNSIKVMITNPEDLPWDVLSTAISQLLGQYHMKKVPVLFYPTEYVETHNVPYEKLYHLWILNTRYGDEYMKFVHDNFRLKY